MAHTFERACVLSLEASDFRQGLLNSTCRRLEHWQAVAAPEHAGDSFDQGSEAAGTVGPFPSMESSPCMAESPKRKGPLKDFLAPFRLAAAGGESGDSSSQDERGRAGHWKCPRHSIACECAPGSEATEHLLPVVSAQWESDGDRRAVLTKLADCGVRTVSALKKVIGTPVWEARLPRTCWFRGAPTLLNELLSEKSKGSKLIKTSTLEDLWVRCCSSEGDTRDLERAISRVCDDRDTVMQLVKSLRLSGLVTRSDLRMALLLPWRELGLRTDIRGLFQQRLVGEDSIDSIVQEGAALDAQLSSVVGSAFNTEAEAKVVKERLKTCGITTVREFAMCAHAEVTEVHPEGCCIAGRSSALNEVVKRRHGKDAMLKASDILTILKCSTIQFGDGSGVLLTAPHGIWLNRQNHPVHKPEVFTTSIASSVALSHGCSHCVWSDEERVKNEFRTRADKRNMDPNYSPGGGLKISPWFRALARHARRFRSVMLHGVLHVDVHGRRDVMTGESAEGVPWKDDSDCDIGVGAMLNMGNAVAGGKLADELHWRLVDALGDRGFKISKQPRLTGFIGTGPPMERPADEGGGFVEGAHQYNTLTMQSVLLGLRAVQLELSLRLRRELRHDDELRGKFAEALCAAARTTHGCETNDK